MTADGPRLATYIDVVAENWKVRIKGWRVGRDGRLEQVSHLWFRSQPRVGCLVNLVFRQPDLLLDNINISTLPLNPGCVSTKLMDNAPSLTVSISSFALTDVGRMSGSSPWVPSFEGRMSCWRAVWNFICFLAILFLSRSRNPAFSMRLVKP